MSLFKISPKTIVLGGLAIAAAAGALKNRDRVAGLIGARSSAPEPPRPEAAPPQPPRTGDPAAPAPANYDLAGPAANTATSVPSPEVLVRDEDGGIDEAAEEAAAAAEAAAIGGGVPEYPGLGMDEEAGEATRPLMEAGEGESEGVELAEFDLRGEAEPRAGETSDAERQILETIEAQDNPALGESMEVVETRAPDAATADDRFNAATADDADDGPTSTAKDDDDPSNDGVREMGGGTTTAGSGGFAGGGGERGLGFAGGKVGDAAGLEGGDSGFAGGKVGDAAGSEAGDSGFAGGKVGGEAPGDPAPGLPNAAAAEAAGRAADDDAPVIHPDQTSLLEDEAPRETPAAEKSSAVWDPPKPATPAAEEDQGGKDEGDSGWQTWSGRANQ